jgi:hypothetical protein
VRLRTVSGRNRSRARSKTSTAIRPQKPQQNLEQQDTQSYAGKVSERHSKFYLEEARSKTSYQLEGTWSAKRYLGKKVRITGTLDTETNVLHVVTISVSP